MKEERDFHEETIHTNSGAKKNYQKPELTVFDDLRVVTGGGSQI